MSDDYRVDPDLLEQLARTLREGGSAVESAGGSMPGAPDAGPATAAMLGAMARLAQSAGTLVEGVGAAAETVCANAASYRDQETAESCRFRSLTG